MNATKTHLNFQTLWLVTVWLGSAAWAEPLPINLNPPGTDPTSAGWHENAQTHDGLTRWFLSYVPTNLAPGAPVVVVLHGGTGGMRTLFSDTAGPSRQWPYIAEREGFLLLVPNAVNPDTGDTAGEQQNWNDLRHPGSDRESTADDVGFIDQVIDWGISTHQADPLRVYMTGGSNGGSMTYRMVMEHGGRLAAVFSGNANLNIPNEKFREPPRPVPMMILLGVEDPLMIYEGIEGSLMSGLDTIEWWRQRNGAAPSASPDQWLPDLNPSDGCRVVRREFAAQSNGAPVVFYRVEGGGHIGPSILHATPSNPLLTRLLGRQCRDLETAEQALSFFQQHRAPFKPTVADFSIQETLSLQFVHGYPAGVVRLFQSESAQLNGAWTEIACLPLDDLGSARFENIDLTEAGSERFYRAQCEP